MTAVCRWATQSGGEKWTSDGGSDTFGMNRPLGAAFDHTATRRSANDWQTIGKRLACITLHCARPAFLQPSAHDRYTNSPQHAGLGCRKFHAAPVRLRRLGLA